VLASLYHLVEKSKRRYGGYVVHVGIAVMFIGFAGRGWSLDKEVSMSPGDTVQFEEYTLKYVGPRMEVDAEKRMIFADVDVSSPGKPVERISPAKFIYKTMGGSASTEVRMTHSLRDDLYMIIGMVNPQTKIASFQMHVNTLISFIWLGAIILVLGTFVAMWPELSFEEAGAWSYVRAAAGAGATIMFGVVLAGAAGSVYAASPPVRAGEVPALHAGETP
jgi:cytochrome c-type biogenesis protein CcmF